MHPRTEKLVGMEEKKNVFFFFFFFSVRIKIIQLFSDPNGPENVKSAL